MIMMILCLSPSLVWLRCSRQRQPVDPIPVVPVVKATRANLSNELVLTAEFIPYQDVDVMAKVAGYVRAIPSGYGRSRAVKVNCSRRWKILRCRTKWPRPLLPPRPPNRTS